MFQMNLQQEKLSMARNDEGNNDVSYLSQRGLAKLLGVSVTTIQRWRNECPDFPQRRAFSYRARGWVKGEIVDWVQSRPAA
jgi:predicted DNA-binding transcriptional regulator AlpA